VKRTFATKPPFFFRFFDPNYLTCRVNTTEKVIYLTFDDGPVPEMTPLILQTLREFNAKATFFMVGDNVRKYPFLFEQIIAEGHAAGNHTYHHLNGWKTAPASYAGDVMECDTLFRTKLFRPPYGRFTPSQYFILRKSYHFVMWSVLTYDFSKDITPEECLRIALTETGPGSVVVFHDNPKALPNLEYALPRFLEHFISLGFRFDIFPTPTE
jgi:peptidoglycan-N-acetylglucosamine deacetylase